MAALFRNRCLGSLLSRVVGVVSEVGLDLGVTVSVGLDAVSLWCLVLLPERGMGMASGRQMAGTAESSQAAQTSVRPASGAPDPSSAEARRTDNHTTARTLSDCLWHNRQSARRPSEFSRAGNTSRFDSKPGPLGGSGRAAWCEQRGRTLHLNLGQHWERRSPSSGRTFGGTGVGRRNARFGLRFIESVGVVGWKFKFGRLLAWRWAIGLLRRIGK